MAVTEYEVQQTYRTQDEPSMRFLDSSEQIAIPAFVLQG